MQANQSIPRLNTTLTEPLYFLENKFLTHEKSICSWFENQWHCSPPPIYGSVDLRNAGFKIAPIDMNLFPAGFNNLNPNFLSLAVSAAKKIIQKINLQIKKVLILPESHTRNLFYWTNIKTLQKILQQAGFEVRIGILLDGFKAKEEIFLNPSEKLVVEPLIRQENFLALENFIPDLILLNNDLSTGIPKILQNLSQPIMPPAELGWSQRLKSEHFHYYAEVTKEFASQFDFDSWLIAPLFRHCGEIDFMQQEGLECVIANADILFSEIQKKYDEYQIPNEPFLIVKADAGTYGMAVMTVRSTNDLKSLNRKQRTRMSMSKGGRPVHRVIIQEGIYTFETIGSENAVAEPVVYLWGDAVIGGFYRMHKERGIDENLNAPGMHFEPIAFSQTCHEPSKLFGPNACQNLFYVYGIVAQLSMLAAAREIKEIENPRKNL